MLQVAPDAGGAEDDGASSTRQSLLRLLVQTLHQRLRTTVEHTHPAVEVVVCLVRNKQNTALTRGNPALPIESGGMSSRSIRKFVRGRSG